MKVRVVSFILIIILVLPQFSGCAEYQDQTNDPSESITDNITLISYCAKEKTEENRIFFNYPQFQDTTDNANKLNDLIVEFVKNALQILDGGFNGNLKDSPENWEWNEDEYTLQVMDIDYKITRNDANYFSVAFEGLFHHIKTPHPMDRVITLTIDKIDEKVIFIDDLYRIDDDFIKFFQRMINERVREGLAQRFQALPDEIPDDIVEYILDSFSDEKLHEIKEYFISNHGYSYPFFLTDEAVGISISIPFAMGSHFEIMISYDELADYLKSTEITREGYNTATW